MVKVEKHGENIFSYSFLNLTRVVACEEVKIWKPLMIF